MITHEMIQLMPYLPFKYYAHDPLTSISVAPHWHQEIELNCLISGETLNFVTDGKTNVYHAGDIWATGRRCVHSASGTSSPNWSEFGLIIDDAFLQKQIPSSVNWQLTLTGNSARINEPQAYERIHQSMLAIHDLLANRPTESQRLLILSYFYQILADLSQSFTVPMIAQDVKIYPGMIDTAIDYIDHAYAQPITGQTLAKQFHVSLTTLNKQFNTSLQMSANQYIRLVRLLKARQFLLETDKQVDYIAGSCGFTNAKTMNRNFKAWKGLTPTEYRQAFAQFHQNDTSCFQK